MFNGIVTEIGQITSVRPTKKEYKGKKGKRIRIKCKKANFFKIKVGDSISVNGVCLTVIKNLFGFFDVEVSFETLSVTTGLDDKGSVNLEKALSYGDKISGHLVSGHVDGVAKVSSLDLVGESIKIIFSVPKRFARFISQKGSIAINGVSLTVNEVNDYENFCAFSINIINHTFLNTTFNFVKKGDLVNFEVDLMARNLNRLLTEKSKLS